MYFTSLIISRLLPKTTRHTQIRFQCTHFIQIWLQYLDQTTGKADEVFIRKMIKNITLPSDGRQWWINPDKLQCSKQIENQINEEFQSQKPPPRFINKFFHLLRIIFFLRFSQYLDLLAELFHGHNMKNKSWKTNNKISKCDVIYFLSPSYAPRLTNERVKKYRYVPTT